MSALPKTVFQIAAMIDPTLGGPKDSRIWRPEEDDESRAADCKRQLLGVTCCLLDARECLCRPVQMPLLLVPTRDAIYEGLRGDPEVLEFTVLAELLREIA